MVPSASHWLAWGEISDWTNSRTVWRNIWCSWVHCTWPS